MLTKVIESFKKSEKLFESLITKPQTTAKDVAILKLYALSQGIASDSFQYNLLQSQLGVLISCLNHPRKISAARARHVEQVGEQTLPMQILELNRFLGRKPDLWDFTLETIDQIEKYALSQSEQKSLASFGISIFYADRLYFSIPSQRHHGSLGKTQIQKSDGKISLQDVSRQMIHISTSLMENMIKHRKNIRRIHQIHESIESLASKYKKNKIPTARIKSIQKNIAKVLKDYQLTRDSKLNKVEGPVAFRAQAPVKTDINPALQELQKSLEALKKSHLRKVQRHLSQVVAALENRISNQNEIFQFHLRKANAVYRAVDSIRKIWGKLGDSIQSELNALKSNTFENQTLKFYYNLSQKIENMKTSVLKNMSESGLSAVDIALLFNFNGFLGRLTGYQAFLALTGKIKKNIRDFQLKDSHLYRDFLEPFLISNFEFSANSLKDILAAIQEFCARHNLYRRNEYLLKEVQTDLKKLLESKTIQSPKLNSRFALRDLINLANDTQQEVFQEISDRLEQVKQK